MYSSIFFISITLAFYDFLHHLNIDFFDWFMLWDGNWHAAGFSESVMTASALWLLDRVPIFLQNSLEFFISEIIAQCQYSR